MQKTPLSSSVEMVNGRPVIFINGEPVYPMIYALTDTPSGRWSWEELPQHNIRNFCESGIRLVQLDIFLEHIWPTEGAWDLTLARKQVAGVLEVCPDAGVIFRFHLRAPRWWLKKHPEEWVVYADTEYIEEQDYGLLRIIEHDNNPVRRVSMASTKWREAVTGKFIQFLNDFSATPEGNALVGIQVANGIYGEWHNWGFYANEPDISQPMTGAFQAWLKEKYGSEEILRHAWNLPDISFSGVTAPGMNRRATEGIIRDPLTERDVIDYFECMHQVVADNIIHFTEVLKTHWPRPIIAGTFYGYYFSAFGRQAPGGHLQLQRILECDTLDYLSGPQAYGPESIKLGDPYRSRSLITSVRLHNKLWLDEMDVEPRIPLLKYESYPKGVHQSVADVRRNTVFSYTKGMGLWFYDFNIAGVDLDGYTHQTSGSQGNWDHPVVMRQIEKMYTLFKDRVLNEPYQTEADTLFVYDTDSFYYTTSLLDTDPVSNTLIDYNTLAAFRSGVIFDPIHIDDLPRIDLDPYRVIVFGNTYVLTEKERHFIQTKVAARNRHLVWYYAPGLIDETSGRRDLALTEDLTGFHLEEVSLDSAPTIELKLDGADPVQYSVGEKPFQPVYGVKDVDAETVAVFSGTGIPAIARKSFPSHTAWYVSLPSKQVQPMKTVLDQAGAHTYGDPDAFFYGGGGILAMHTLKGGPRLIRLRSGSTVQLDLPEGPATVLLDSRTGQILMQDYDSEQDKITVQY